MTEAMPFLQKTILLSYDPRPFRRGIFFLVAPGESKFIPAGAPKNIPRLSAGDIFPVAPGESKFIPGRGNPRWSAKKSFISKGWTFHRARDKIE